MSDQPCEKIGKRGRRPSQDSPFAPPPGVATSPPEVVGASPLDWSAPTLTEVSHLPYSEAKPHLPSVNKESLEGRISVLARLIIEETLWQREGLSKRERCEIALQAIRTLEGTKSAVAVKDDRPEVPKTQEELAHAKDELDKRIATLLAKDKHLRKATDTALQLVAVEREMVKGGEA